MSDVAICVENLGKKYLLSHQQEGDRYALRYAIANGVKRWGKRLLHPRQGVTRPELEEFWALQDLSFEIKRGDRVGIIGRNGAGKSTLLKILSRITEPTTGRITLNGRVASLLEVGTGFHPELTGRENIYLNGSILGMSRQEINRKFDEIVAFAEIEKFLDTPVKRYSSGMYVRLAFAVAAHLEPEILVIDEVLAVGDAQFQKKCLGKMETVGKEGRTVIFVSHQMGMVNQLCSKAFLLNQGQIIVRGTPATVIQQYLGDFVSNTVNHATRSDHNYQTKEIYIDHAETVNSKGIAITEFMHNEPIFLTIHCQVNQWLNHITISAALKDRQNRKIFTTESELSQQYRTNDKVTACIKIPANLLAPNPYFFEIAVHIRGVKIIDLLDEVCSFRVNDLGSELAHYEGLDYGCIFAPCEWIINPLVSQNQ
ncbi:ABC transporter ATP-binding protein [Spirulina subsalsa FACHB-351]|uniref:ABC transporter ATP-binding protein n=1 Tax=Spirulina subsalsa FACHB-351 TaxID=234711 RepID=A0ABT3L794_9CYAN|nr:ABC transporter ATP-binding protein [Spirulina subsalsa]MCW6036954.1 ABC transporter ATP-binding protein [Spirulina subsalsa FACHB-351]